MIFWISVELVSHQCTMHAQCDILVNCVQEWHGYCSKHRKSLTAMALHASHVLQADGHTCPSNHNNYLYLTNEEKSERLC